MSKTSDLWQKMEEIKFRLLKGVKKTENGKEQIDEVRRTVLIPNEKALKREIKMLGSMALGVMQYKPQSKKPPKKAEMSRKEREQDFLADVKRKFGIKDGGKHIRRRPSSLQRKHFRTRQQMQEDVCRQGNLLKLYFHRTFPYPCFDSMPPSCGIPTFDDFSYTEITPGFHQLEQNQEEHTPQQTSVPPQLFPRETEDNKNRCIVRPATHAYKLLN